MLKFLREMGIDTDDDAGAVLRLVLDDLDTRARWAARKVVLPTVLGAGLAAACASEPAATPPRVDCDNA